jgi:hypothetical protein
VSIKWINYVWEESPYDGRRLLLHLALADFANDEGTCFPSLKTLASKARCTDTWCSLTIKQMVKEDWLEIVEQGRGRGRASTYRLLKKGLTELNISEPKTLIPSTENINSDEVLTIYKNHIEPNIVQDFELFWKAYPRKVAKRQAQKSFAKLMVTKDAPTIKQLLDGVERYKATTLDPKYIAHPATWLNQGRWEDDVTTPHVKTQTDTDYERDNVVRAVLTMRNAGYDLERVQNFLQTKRDDLREIGLQIFREGITK